MKIGQHVYFIKPVGMDGPIKIGCSDKPTKRLLVLAAWSPFELEMMGSVPGTFKDENNLHRRFANLHTRKEWFLSSPLLRQTIERILGGTSIAEACKTLQERGRIRGNKLPAKTPDRENFLSYGRRIRAAAQSVYQSGEYHRHYPPADIKAIMNNWRVDRTHDHVTITPTSEQFSRLDEFIANPHTHCVRFKEAFGCDPFAAIVEKAA